MNAVRFRRRRPVFSGAAFSLRSRQLKSSINEADVDDLSKDARRLASEKSAQKSGEESADSDDGVA